MGGGRGNCATRPHKLKKGSVVWKYCGFKPEDDEQCEVPCKGCLQSFVRGYLTNVLRFDT